ncbi:hypothetical protein KIL84_003521 [Mauremys mutica]|uniref:Uncharacterized protein n=1 Tax=Mauremys mutica TaxID=74926 RepID=A0A9D3WVD4_9SAUR|nr:hypothetical protein KIL84_003521 [Mauremys mutica]
MIEQVKGLNGGSQQNSKGLYLGQSKGSYNSTQHTVDTQKQGLSHEPLAYKKAVKTLFPPSPILFLARLFKIVMKTLFYFKYINIPLPNIPVCTVGIQLIMEVHKYLNLLE